MITITSDYALASERLHRGKLIAIPTETVYGLAADASNPDAVRQIYQVKQRPSNHPLIVHIASADQLSDWADDIPDIAYTLAEAFWPGPLTFILPKAPSINTAVTGGQNTIGLRCPNHPLTLQLLTTFKGGLAAPSANRFGHISPTKPEHVQSEFTQAEVDLILDGGQSIIGIESTILDLTATPPRILREGAITADMIRNICNISVINHKTATSPQVSGSLDKHYAPDTPTMLVTTEKLQDIINDNQNKRIAILAHSEIHEQHLQKSKGAGYWFQMPKEAKGYAHQLYDTLRQADASDAELIIIEAIPNTPEWDAIRDRVTKSSH